MQRNSFTSESRLEHCLVPNRILLKWKVFSTNSPISCLFMLTQPSLGQWWAAGQQVVEQGLAEFKGLCLSPQDLWHANITTPHHSDLIVHRWGMNVHVSIVLGDKLQLIWFWLHSDSSGTSLLKFPFWAFHLNNRYLWKSIYNVYVSIAGCIPWHKTSLVGMPLVFLPSLP